MKIAANRDDEQEQRALRKRQQDAERTSRLLNAKLRTIGVDVASLDVRKRRRQLLPSNSSKPKKLNIKTNFWRN